MALTIPKANETWKLTTDHGVGPGYVAAGAAVKVTGVHAPGTPGLGYSEEDTVVAEYLDVDGALRILALPVTGFTSLLKKVS